MIYMLSLASELIQSNCASHQNIALVNFTHDITFGNNQISMIISEPNIVSCYKRNQIPTLCTDKTGRTLAEGVYLNKTLENSRKDCALLMPLLRKIGLKYKQNYGQNSVHILTKEHDCQHFYSLFFDLSENDFLQWVVNNGSFLSDFIVRYNNYARDLILEAKSHEHRLTLPNTSDVVNLKKCQINNSEATLTLLHKELHLPIHLSKQQSRCLLLLVQGKSAKEIASELLISYRTVEYYFDKIRKQLGCSSNKKLVADYGDQLY